MAAKLLCHFRHLLSHRPPLSSPFRRSLHLNPTTSSHLTLTSELLSLFSILAGNPNSPKILRSVDAILAQSHLLDCTTSVLVLRGLAQSSKLTRAKTLLSSLNKRAQISNFFLYSIVLQSLLPQNPIRDVESVWNEVSAIPFGEFTEIFVFYICRRCDDAVDIELLCRRILSSRWPLSAGAFAALIGALCLKKNPNPNFSREVLMEMVERAFEVDDFCYYTVFRSFCRIGDVSGADSVLRSMIQRRNYELDLFVYEDFLHCLCKAGKFREARKLFDRMLKRGKIHDLGLGNNLKPGRRIIFQLSSPNLISETMAFEAYFRSLCSHGRLEEAEILVEEAAGKHIMPVVSVDKEFVNALFSTGRHDEAIRFFESKRKKRDVSAGDIAATVISGLCNNKRVDKSHELACELANEGYVLTSCVWNLIMKSYWEDGRAEKAMDVFEGIKSGNFCAFLRPDGSTYEIMIRGLLSIGMVEKATRVLEEMGRRKFAPSVDLYSVLVRTLHCFGRSKEAHGYLNFMIENGVFVSYAQWEVLFKSLTSIYVGGIFPRTNQGDYDAK
ncbi:hypothetical protein KSP39_PZI008851 [Platanthera zijinensis]|uniref:Pentatricopeptide repeat-containing protein n=1 Tax=Platanthera zijinensis TaxID=2320716 RepID=A0AAP0BM39_9ASPA